MCYGEVVCITDGGRDSSFLWNNLNSIIGRAGVGVG